MPLNPWGSSFYIDNSQKEIEHSGVKGMKWGVRKDRLKMTTKSGDTITLSEHPDTRLASFLAKHSKKVAQALDKTAIYDIRSPDNKKVGDLILYKEKPDSININWVSTTESVRGRGYGTATVKAAIQIAKDTKAKQVTLEVPGDSPDARHIYEKLGFKEIRTVNNDPDEWGGLTSMRLDLQEVEHSSLSHGDVGLIVIPEDVKKRYAVYLVAEINKLYN